MLGSSKEGKIRSAPAYTIIGRQKQPLPQAVQFPGPGTYDGRYETILNKAPNFTMADRVGRTEKALGPGPGAHFPEKVLRIGALVLSENKRFRSGTLNLILFDNTMNYHQNSRAKCRQHLNLML